MKEMSIDEKETWLCYFADAFSVWFNGEEDQGVRYGGSLRKNFTNHPLQAVWSIEIKKCSSHKQVIERMWDRAQEDLIKLLYTTCLEIEDERQRHIRKHL